MACYSYRERLLSGQDNQLHVGIVDYIILCTVSNLPGTVVIFLLILPQLLG